MAESFVEFVHEDAIVGLTKVFMGVASELVVAINHTTNSLHDPLSLVNWADDVLVSVEDGNGDFIDGGDGDIGRDPTGLSGSVLVRELLESAFDAVLEVVLKGL